MKSDRITIAAVLFLAAGIGVIFAYGHGAATFSFGYPVSATSLHFDMTTTGVPALVGLPLVVIGTLLLLISLIVAIVSQFTGAGAAPSRELELRRNQPFEE
jgi:hypothetical protein